MKEVKNIAKNLFYLSRFCAFVYAFLTIYSTISLLTGWSLKFEGDYFNILFPFTKQTILIGEYNLTYILLDYLLVFVLYGIFFWLLGNVLKVFMQTKLFTQKNINQLKYFYILNLFVPSLATLIAYTFSTIDRDVILLIILHFIIGIFSYFLAQIFKQGVDLQNEQDLYI
ncbi:DUF2975 domain-containing protein [Flavobacterium rhizosphaerae]|uniref:DUF2975 domain-containing protein n=1 Tax=Flavobacterium rhizosphaerae TaxID=3163298 RepID=A0ABW8Z1G7_9FLAO